MRFTSSIAVSIMFAFFGLGGVVGEGINCEGSIYCVSGDSAAIEDIANVIVEQIDHNRFYNNAEQIACKFNICAFLQDSGGAPGSSIATLIVELEQHGCGTCGSIPLFYPSDNNVKDGMLTVNYVSNTCAKSGEVDAVMC